MTIDELNERRDKAVAEFNQLQTQNQQNEVRMSELRGVYQVLTEQIDNFGSKKKVSPKANVVDVTSVEGA